MVHENTRFLKPVRKVREIIDSGAIGKPTWARVSFRTGHNIYGKQPYLAKVENFVILDLGVHMLDVARFLMGDAAPLYCQTQSIKPGIRGEDMATILLQHESGATSVVEASYASPIHPDPFPQLRVQVEGTAGSLRLDPGYQLSVFSTAQRRKSTSRRRCCRGRCRPGMAPRRASYGSSNIGCVASERSANPKPRAWTA